MKPGLRLALATTAAVVAGVAVIPATQAMASSYDHLNPGGQPNLTEKVKVNVVFVGYEPTQVNKGAFTGALPKTYEPVARSRLPYGITEKLGLKYTYDYQVQYTSKAYEDKFFTKLKGLAKPAPLTTFQQQYNDEQKNVLDVKDNHEIDAPTVEHWLATNPPSGVDVKHDTVFLINWYGRKDFVHHVYTKTDEPDPDTGYNFGKERASRKLIAWGGTTPDDLQDGNGKLARVWFHDLSAGPESWTQNWNVDTKDLDGNGVEDYRMPPTWEYTAKGYRAASELTGDLAKITRYVALNLLFTTSPLYPAELPTAAPPKSINLDVNTYEGWTGVNAGAAYIKPKLLLDQLKKLRWRNTLDYDHQDLTYAGAPEDCYTKQLANVSCYPETGYPAGANLFLQGVKDLPSVLDDQGKVDYELPVYNYSVNAGVGTPALGYADDNYTDGTQSFVFGFISPEVVAAGYGLTTTLIHEIGHHLGMSHPHDGYDSETGVDYGPGDATFFANSGDENNSMMSYIDLNWDFSQFDRDNSDRFLLAAYNEAANKLAAKVIADPDAGKAEANLEEADSLLGQAQAALSKQQYRGAYGLAQRAYEQVVYGAKKAGVPVTPSTPSLAGKGVKALPGKALHAAGEAHDGNEFIDTLSPHSPRSQP
ncbi:MAG: hypothetical protein JWO79_1999 [Actinomycetia bacterium]|nr:hypothetical protein [Actinomycetes bacterium]